MARIYKYVFILAAFVIFSLAVRPVFAVGKPDGVGGGKPSSLPEQAQGHLTEGKLQSCLAREKGIKNRAQHLNQLATNMQEQFDVIAGRVEEYYTKSGKTITEYDTLLADITSKKAAVTAALAVTKADADNFTCEGLDPKGQVTKYREDMQSVIQALKDYRTSIKNLIVAVRSANGATNRANPSNSPHPTGKGQSK